jgi:hypothetical protein
MIMALYVCPDCEVLVDTMRYLSRHVICDNCGYEGSLFLQSEWPKNYLPTLMHLRDYYKSIYFSADKNKFRDIAKHYKGLMDSANFRINKICSDYGVDINDIKKY